MARDRRRPVVCGRQMREKPSNREGAQAGSTSHCPELAGLRDPATRGRSLRIVEDRR
ncbi:MAG: hypothetical protein ACE5JU_08330 [Candidatus Binatia bacterium]